MYRRLSLAFKRGSDHHMGLNAVTKQAVYGATNIREAPPGLSIEHIRIILSLFGATIWVVLCLVRRHSG